MIADGVIVNAVADGHDDARALVTQDQRQRILNRAVGRRQIAVANAAGRHAHHHLAVPRLGNFDLFDQDGLADFARQNCFRQLSHRVFPIRLVSAA